MSKILSALIKIIIIGLLIYTCNIVQENNNLNKVYFYIYLFICLCSLLCDRFFFSGQKSENKKEYQVTSNYLELFWFVSLIAPVLEYAYFIRYNLVIMVVGVVLVSLGIIIRGSAIKTLGKYFSRDVETWDNHLIVKTGIYKYIRHPAYAGNILQIVGFPLILNSYFCLILSLLTVIGFLWRIGVEEEFLVRSYPEYKDYINTSKRIIPKLW